MNQIGAIMENRNLNEIIKELAYNGRDYDAILKELESQNSNFSGESIDAAKRRIDDYIVDFQLASQERRKGREHMIIGFFF